MSRFIKSFLFAITGIKYCITKEANFRIHIICAILVIAAGLFFRINQAEWVNVFICIGFVLCMEMINTAIEQLCNIVRKETHAGIKVIKDISAAAVLISAIIAFICGSIIFIPKIIIYLNSIIK